MADSQVLKALLPDNPICGISTYKDTLNLATGACTRQIYKLVLHGTESYGKNVTGTYQYYMAVNPLHKKVPICVCSHLPSVDDYPADVIGVHTTRWANNAVYLNFGEDVMLAQPSGNTVDGLKEYITAQYNAGTPVTIWYIMGTATTETIPVPSGLSGTEEGYLTQSGTPSPSAPIYPTANTVNVWQHSLWEMKSATETIQSGDTIYANGQPITTYTLKGNTTQSGTPTPSNPVEVNGVGERTENIYNKYNTIEVRNLGIRYGQYVPQDVYSIYNDTDNDVIWGTNDMQSRFTACQAHSTATLDMTIYPSGQNFGFIMPYNDASLGDITIVQGSTVPDHYIPYGYEIPILTAQGSAVNYLGSVQSERKIKKIVLTGQESPYTYTYDGTNGVALKDVLDTNYNHTDGVCTHYPVARSNVANTLWIGASNANLYFVGILDVMGYTTYNQFMQYLADQYAAGTPVTVWYLLATPTTGIVNEPLMKLVDRYDNVYADSISNAVSIPTTDGANTITVDTTVQPSEFTATWKGWHDSSVKEYDGSDWQ